MIWLTQSWWKLLDPVSAAISLTAIALVCGAMIGSEREKKEKPAGMRTLIFVCLGATIFTMVGFTFSSNTGDSGRVAAQVVTGIGFLGAGVILHGRGMVSGATTAATIWVTASIGMTVGAGYGPASVALAMVSRLVLVGVRAYEYRFIERVRPVTLTIVFDPDHGKARARLLRVLADFNVFESACDWGIHNERFHQLQLTLRLAHRPLRELVEEVAEISQVTDLTETAAS